MLGETFSVHATPKVFHEPYIVSGYRRVNHRSFLECVASMFTLNNEFANVWTHLIPCLIYVRVLYLMLMREGVYASYNETEYSCMLLFIVGNVLLFFLSAFAHMFNSYSVRARHFAFRLDYCGIVFFGYATTVSTMRLHNTQAYLNQYQLAYEWFAAIYCSILGFLICSTREWPRNTQYIGRTLMLATLWVVGNLAGLMRLIYDPNPDHLSMGFIGNLAFYVVTAFFNTTKFPERQNPGRFDLFFNSHCLFHITSFLANYSCEYGLLDDVQRMKNISCAGTETCPPSWHLHPQIALVVTSLALAAFLTDQNYTRNVRKRTHNTAQK